MSVINKVVMAALSPLLRKFDQGCAHPGAVQEKVFRELLDSGKRTVFGNEHGFGEIRDYRDYIRRVPVREYDQFAPYIERLRRGENYVLWNEKVRWFAKSSGTSSDKSKYIPVTPANLSGCHYSGFKTMLATYIRRYPDSGLFRGKALTLGGSVRVDELSDKGARNGDLSAILLSNSPSVAEIVRTPSKDIAMLADFEQKIEGICRVCSKQNVTNFSGVPSWNLIMIEKLLEYNNAKYLTDIWPNLELFMHGGISFGPYRERYRRLIPSERMHYLENYNASEGYFALQDDPAQKGMALTLDNGVFFEFIPMRFLEKVLAGESDEVYTVNEVRTGVTYAMVITTNSGLWRYLIGDCVEFTSLCPHRIIITGRTRLYINAFGEELMIHNAEEAMSQACRECGVEVTDYTVAPVFMDESHDKGAHQWVVEFAAGSQSVMKDPERLEHFGDVLDAALCQHNSDYEAKRTGNVTMTRLVLSPVPVGTFYGWMHSRGKTGGQNKVPRLSNDRKIVEQILNRI
ncbi:MAG TPA: GH3 auxin-responsive promoter family protein [Candidatus Coprenecus stercoravium]|uniref:GH3 auxin-responsive promoter family protein n=1 Tax=Candidatus Coprenecus stercoravium TaxID=2840735 RepID=A0A9D2GNR9_9BACT|nr:GH3 auxin-responsive promoter family protein [Candidatus Coprenecus stercoravium]